MMANNSDSTPPVTAKQTGPTESKSSLNENVEIAEPALTTEEIIRAHVNPHLVTFCEVPFIGPVEARFHQADENPTNDSDVEHGPKANTRDFGGKHDASGHLHPRQESLSNKRLENRDGGEQVTKRLRDFG
uniref:Uncharacterized protein n=1 Tax=Panagrellus redivivus TaxID=6233 RepID=A0A7E4V843_PANRE